MEAAGPLSRFRIETYQRPHPGWRLLIGHAVGCASITNAPSWICQWGHAHPWRQRSGHREPPRDQSKCANSDARASHLFRQSHNNTHYSTSPTDHTVFYFIRPTPRVTVNGPARDHTNVNPQTYRPMKMTSALPNSRSSLFEKITRPHKRQRQKTFPAVSLVQF